MTIAWASKEEFLDQLEFYDLELRYIKGMSRSHQLQDLCLGLRKLCGWLICLPDTKIEKEMVSREAKETQVCKSNLISLPQQQLGAIEKVTKIKTDVKSDIGKSNTCV